MKVEIGTEAAQFPEKEYIYGIFVTVWGRGEGWVIFTVPHNVIRSGDGDIK
jgi:hypothetical protein